MKKILLLTFAIALITICKAQQFSYQMIFVDAAGNTDSLILGYDVSATDTIDAALGEVNIMGTPYSSGLDVRVGNVWWQQQWPPMPMHGQIPFETKKQILPSMCDSTYLSFCLASPVAEINIISHHFPIKAYWDKVPFNDTCRNGSVFTSVHPGGWWDTAGFREELALKDSAIFDRTYIDYMSGTDTVNVYWVAFYDSTLLALGAGINEQGYENNLIDVFPNPASTIISLKSKKGFGEATLLTFHNAYGENVLTLTQPGIINISELKTGLYFIKATNKQGLTTVSKFQKL